jgi:hypothetical protein
MRKPRERGVGAAFMAGEITSRVLRKPVLGKVYDRSSRQRFFKILSS